MDIFTRYVISEAVSVITGVDSASLDVEYAKAVESGNTEKAMRMVRDMASTKMPDTKVADMDGLPLVVWKGSSGSHTVFDFSNRFNYFTNDRSVAEIYDGEIPRRKGLRRFFLNILNPFVEDFNGDSYSFHIMNIEKASKYKIDLQKDEESGKAFTDTDSMAYCFQTNKELEGFDGLIMNDVLEQTGSGDFVIDDYIVRHPHQIKSADITYDDSGNLIPLSKRFDFSNPDIRY